MDNMMDLITGESSERETCCVLFVCFFWFLFFLSPCFLRSGHLKRLAAIKMVSDDVINVWFPWSVEGYLYKSMFVAIHHM